MSFWIKKLFGFGKEKKEQATSCHCHCSDKQSSDSCCKCREPADDRSIQHKPTPDCACHTGAPEFEAPECCCKGGSCQINSIKVLGAGCKKCHEQYEYCQSAIKELGLNVCIEYITDMEIIMKYDVISMPALVVNEKVIVMGKVLKPADLINLLKKHGYC